MCEYLLLLDTKELIFIITLIFIFLVYLTHIAYKIIIKLLDTKDINFGRLTLKEVPLRNFNTLKETGIIRNEDKD